MKDTNTARIGLYCLPSQKEKWESLARKEGLSLSAWIKKTLNEAAKKEK